jgi:nitrate/TMAO reductase-like tetraheme cytochrome c subunit
MVVFSPSRMTLATIFVALALLSGFLVLSDRALAQQQFPSSAFTSAETCGGCHADIYEQWSETILSQAYRDPFYRARMEEAVRDTQGRLADFCIKCHSPIGVFAEEHLPIDGSRMSAIAVRGVQCDFCHTISGIDGISNGGYLNTPGNVKRGPFKDAVSPFHETVYSVLHTRSEICGICHDIYNPDNGLRLESTYFEWREGPYGKQNITCQDCHMTPGPGVTKPNPGQAAIGGPAREHIYTHHFVGANVLYGNRDLAIERLRAAAQLDISVPEKIESGKRATLDVTVRNVGAGHYLPTSLTYIRQMWLDVEVKDAAGQSLFRDRVMYNTILEDANGLHDGSVPAWRAESIYRDYRIPPAGQVTENFTFVTPLESRGQLSVTAVLNYRSADPQMTARYNLPEFPIVEMTRAEATLQATVPSALRAILISLTASLWWAGTAVLLVLACWAVFGRAV